MEAVRLLVLERADDRERGAVGEELARHLPYVVGVTSAMRASMSSTDICSPQHSSLLPIRFISAPVSSRPRTVEPESWPMARVISSSSRPWAATRSNSSRQIFRTSWTWLGRQPA